VILKTDINQLDQCCKQSFNGFYRTACWAHFVLFKGWNNFNLLALSNHIPSERLRMLQGEYAVSEDGDRCVWSATGIILNESHTKQTLRSKRTAPNRLNYRTAWIMPLKCIEWVSREYSGNQISQTDWNHSCNTYVYKTVLESHFLVIKLFTLQYLFRPISCIGIVVRRKLLCFCYCGSGLLWMQSHLWASVIHSIEPFFM
jgi:hypothetical protein